MSPQNWLSREMFSSSESPNAGPCQHQGSYSGTGPTVTLWAKFKQKKPGVCGTHKTLYYFRWVVTLQTSCGIFMLTMQG